MTAPSGVPRWLNERVRDLGVHAPRGWYLIDGVMVLMHQMEKVPQNDLSELPELQQLLKRLMSG